MKGFFALLFISFLFSSFEAQTSSPYAPESGTYEGYSYMVGAGFQYGFDLITGFGVKPSATLNPTPSVLGPLKIKNNGNNKGTYSLPEADMAGTWAYDDQTHQLTFTGPLEKGLKNYYAGKSSYSLELVIKSDEDGDFSLHYSKAASKPFPKLENPNRNLTGTLSIKPDFGSVGFFDISKGVYKHSYSGAQQCTNPQGYTVTVGFTDDPHYFDIDVFDPQGEKVPFFTRQDIRAKEWYFQGYNFGVLNQDQSRLALLGTIPRKWNSAFSFTSEEDAIFIADSEGNVLGQVFIDFRNSIKPWFHKDHSLIYCKRGGGIAVADPSYQSVKTIYDQQINCFSLSPDEKKIAFSEGLHFYTMD
ncbi:MAG: hypothetical protein ACR2MX_03790, partial [Cyclobacteriaceae bacterium]